MYTGNYANFSFWVNYRCKTLIFAHSCFICFVYILQDFPWIVADEQEVHMEEAKLIPLKTMTSDILKVRHSQLQSDFIASTEAQNALGSF